MSRKKKHRRRPKLLSMQRHDSIELYQLEPLKDYRKKTGFGIQSLTAEESHRATLAQHPMSMPVGTIRLGDKTKNDDDDENDPMIISSSSSLTRMQASLLSPDGNYLAVSDAVSTYVFYLKYNGDDTHDENDSDSDQPGTGPIEPIKLSLPKILQNVSATAFHFVNDDLYIGDSNNRKVHIVRLKRELEAVGDVDEADNGDPMDVDDDKLSSSSASIAMSIRSVSLPGPQQDTNRNSESIALLAIQSISVSEDGKFLVTMNRSRNNAIHIFLNRKDKNKRKRRMPQFEHYWSLPSLGNGTDASRPAAITMMNGNKLAVATYRSHVYLFDIDSKKLNTWSEQLGYPVTDNKWTEDSLCGRGYPLRLIPLKEQTDDSRLIMASFGTFCVIDFSKPIPRQCRYVPRRRAWKNRRKYKPIVHEVEDDPDDNTAEVEDEEKKIWLESRVSKPAEDEYSTELMSNTATPNAVSDEEIAADRRSCTVCSHYKNMLYTEFLGPKEMIVVEQPWLDVVETFPAALQRRIYGAD